MTVASTPILPDELDQLFAILGDGHDATAVALAVSGGIDSTALMVLFVDWLHRRGALPDIHTVLTVDHGLRSESVDEAGAVASRARAFGFRHATLVWEGLKPSTGIQAAARQARYRLMSGYLCAHGITTLLTAHTLDDQAETLLMRLARGSGLDGLTAIAASTRMGSLRLVRPLLDTAKSRLRATLEQRGISWIEDPSNLSPVFERTRLRAARAEIDALGLTDEMLSLSVRRLQRARGALDAMTDRCCAEMVDTDACGVLTIDRARFGRAPEEIALRLLERCIAAAGGSGEPVPLARLEALVDSLRFAVRPTPGSWTLSRALIATTEHAVIIEREPGRLPLPQIVLAAGARALWDGRFAVTVSDGWEGNVEVRALSLEGIAELRRLGCSTKGARALRLVASFWRDGRLLAVPAINFGAMPEVGGLLSATFVGLPYNSSASANARSSQSDAPC